MMNDLPSSFLYFKDLSERYNSETGQNFLEGLHYQLPNIVSFNRCLGENYFELTKNNENLVTDVGLRKSGEPLSFIKKYLFKINMNTEVNGYQIDHFLKDIFFEDSNEVEINFDHQKFVARCLENGEVQHLNQVLESYVNFLGSWKDALQISEAIFIHRALLKEDSHRLTLLHNVACVMAVNEDVRSRELFAEIIPQWSDPYHQFFTSLRCAAAEIKRFRDPERANKALEELNHLAKSIQNVEGYSADDSIFTEAVALNLNALVHVYNGDLASARQMIAKSLSNIEIATHEKIKFDRHAADRYRIQIIVNGSLLLSSLGDFKEAISQLEKCLVFVREHHDYSVEEVASVLAYNYIQAGFHSEAHELLLEQESRLALFPAVERRRQVWKMLSVSSDALGRIEESQKWLMLVNSHEIEN